MQLRGREFGVLQINATGMRRLGDILLLDGWFGHMTNVVSNHNRFCYNDLFLLSREK